MTKHIGKNRVSNIEKLFLNYTDKYEKINLNWDNEVGKEIWYSDEEKNQDKTFYKGRVKMESTIL